MGDIPKLSWALVEGKTDTFEAIGVGTENMPEKKFKFKLTRYKDDITKRERLVIKSILNDEDNGSVETTIDNLDVAFKELMQYGVIFTNSVELIKLKKRIVEVYLNIETMAEDENIDGDKLDAFLTGIGEYIQLSEKDNTEDLCFIPVGIFDEIATDYDYKSYELQRLRMALKNKGYLHSDGNRLAILVRYQGKPTRVIALKRKSMQDKSYVDSKYYIELQQKEKDKADK